jgi:hypothetical protein
MLESLLPLKECGFRLTLKNDVPMIMAGIGKGNARDQSVPANFGNLEQDRVGVVSSFIFKIDTRNEVTEQAASKHQNEEVRRLKAAVAEGYRAWLQDRTGETAFAVGCGAAKPGGQIFRGGKGIRIATGEVSAPELEQGVGDRDAVAVDDPTRQSD